jgi:hypothetical protein
MSSYRTPESTLKTQIYTYFTYKKKYRYIDVLDRFVNGPYDNLNGSLQGSSHGYFSYME